MSSKGGGYDEGEDSRDELDEKEEVEPVAFVLGTVESTKDKGCIRHWMSSVALALVPLLYVILYVVLFSVAQTDLHHCAVERTRLQEEYYEFRLSSNVTFLNSELEALVSKEADLRFYLELEFAHVGGWKHIGNISSDIKIEIAMEYERKNVGRELRSVDGWWIVPVILASPFTPLVILLTVFVSYFALKYFRNEERNYYA
jgi:hypothetical protein